MESVHQRSFAKTADNPYGKTLTVDKALEALAGQSAPKTILHGLTIQGLGRSQGNVLGLLGILSALGAATTFISVFVEIQTPDLDCSNYTGRREVGVGVQGMAEEWGLECGSEWKLALMGTLFFGGSAVGVAAGGHLADTVGRRKTLLGATALAAMAIPLAALAPNWIIYAALKIPQGAAVSLAVLVSYTLALECMPQAWHTPVGTVFLMCCFALGELALVLASLALTSLDPFLSSSSSSSSSLSSGQQWRRLTFTVGLPWAMLLPLLYRGVAESPRWLLAKGYVADAEKVLQDAFAQQPGATFRFESLVIDEGSAMKKTASLVMKDTESSSVDNLKISIASPSHSPATKVVRSQTAASPIWTVLNLRSSWAMVLLWFTSALTYYGLTLSSSSLEGSLHLNAALSALMEIPACVLAAVLLDHPRAGRRPAVSLFFLLAGLCCMGPSFRLPSSSLAIAATMLGKLAITAAFDSIYQYASELFPTVVRSTAMGICSAAARLGSMLAPPVASLLSPGGAAQLFGGSMFTPTPSQIFGTFSLLAAAACYTQIPETRR